MKLGRFLVSAKMGWRYAVQASKQLAEKVNVAVPDRFRRLRDVHGRFGQQQLGALHAHAGNVRLKRMAGVLLEQAA